MSGNIVEVIHKIWTLFRELGIQGCFKHLHRFVGSTLNDNVVYRKPLKETKLFEEHSEVLFRVASPDDIAWISQNMPHLGNKAETILRDQFHGKDMTIIGISKREPKLLVFTIWLSQSDFGMNLLQKHVETGDMSLRRRWVPESHRRFGLATHGEHFAEQVARQPGVKNLWVFVMTDNIPSRKLHEKLGYQEFGGIQLVTRWGKRYARIKTKEEPRWRCVRIPDTISKF